VAPKCACRALVVIVQEAALVLLAVEEISQKCVIYRSPSRVTCTMHQELDLLVLLV
jgi:hypothetical protein